MFVRLSTSSLALAVALAAPGLALTPDELWTTWTTSYEAMGYTVSEETRDLSGDTLTLGGVTLTIQGPDGTGEGMTVSVPEIVMQQAGDGSVRTTFPDSMPLRIDALDEEGRPVVVEMTLTAPDLDVQSSGEPEAVTDTYSGPSITVSVDRIDLADEPDLEDVATITFNEVSGETLNTNAGRDIRQSTRSGPIEYSVTVDRAEEGRVTASGSFASSEATGEVSGAAEGAPGLQEAMNEALKAGAVIAGTFSLGTSSHEMEFEGTDDEGQATSGNLALDVGPVQMTMRLAEDGMAYQGNVTGIDTRLSGAEMPFPVAYQIGELSFDVQFPVTAAEAPQPFKIAYSLGGVSLDEAIWATFDPNAELPRDPASLDIDLTGKVRVTQDLFDPALAQAAADASDDDAADDGTDGAAPDDTADATDSAEDDASMPMPVEPVELTINQFAIDAVGARISAEGQLAPSASGEFTEPVGSVTARIEGANALIDRLTAMGLLPEEQVQAVRMMLALFTRPGETPDTLTSEFEFREGGEIFANGQQIK